MAIFTALPGRGLKSATHSAAVDTAPAPERPFLPTVVEAVQPAATPTAGIAAFWDDHPGIAALFPAGQLWSGAAPEIVSAMPYAVLIEVSAPVEDRSTAFRTIRATYQINCMASTLGEAESLALAVADAFDRAELSIAGVDIMHCLAGESHWTLGVGLGLGGLDCWVCYVEIEIYWSR